MADLTFRIKGDFSQLKRDFNRELQSLKGASLFDKLGLPYASTSEQKGNKEEKKQTTLLSGILKATGVLAILASLKPLVDLTTAIASSVFGLFIRFLEFIGVFDSANSDNLAKADENAKAIREAFVEKMGEAKDAIVNMLVSVWEWIVKLPGKIWDKFKEWADALPGKIKDAIVGFFKKNTPADEAKDAKTAKTLLGSVLTVVKKLVNPLLGVGGKDKGYTTSEEFQSSLMSRMNVNDAIVTKDGRVIQTNPNDSIIATQNPGGMGGTKIINFYGVTPTQFIREIKRELGIDILKSGGRF